MLKERFEETVSEQVRIYEKISGEIIVGFIHCGDETPEGKHFEFVTEKEAKEDEEWWDYVQKMGWLCPDCKAKKEKENPNYLVRPTPPPPPADRVLRLTSIIPPKGLC